MSIPSEGPRETPRVTENLWPSQPITLEPEEFARKLVLRKIQEFSILVRREVNSHPFLCWYPRGFLFTDWKTIRPGFPWACAG